MFDCMGKDSQNSDSKSEYSKREEDILEFESELKCKFEVESRDQK